MSVTYTWEITGMKVKTAGPNENAVYQTYWKKKGTDENGKEGVFSGATPFSVDNIPPEAFVPFENLTEETVLSWVKSVVVDAYEKHVNAQIQRQIDSQYNDAREVDLPWKPARVAPPNPPEVAPAP